MLLSCPRRFKAGTDCSLCKRDVVLVQEFPRAKEGWHSELLGHLKAVTFRPKGMWRGTGLLFDSAIWNIVSRRYTRRGVWIHLRHLESQEAVWFSTAHFSPGVTHEVYEAEVEDHLRAKPRQCRALVFQADLNCSFRWWRDRERVEVSGKDGKARYFCKVRLRVRVGFRTLRGVPVGGAYEPSETTGAQWLAD